MRWAIGKQAAGGLVLAGLVLLLSGLLSYQNIRAIARNEAIVLHTHEALDAMNLTLSTIKDAETGQRGFIITADPDYLKPYNDARAGLYQLLDRLQRLTADNASQQQRMVKLRAAVENRLNSLEQGIEITERDGTEGGRAFVRLGLGRSQMLEVRASVQEMIEEEKRLLAVRSTDSATTYRTAIVTTSLTTGLGLALVGIVYFMTARAMAVRARMTEELEHRVVERTEELNRTNAALQISNRELEQFASVASHDLQEPLRKIEAFGDRLKTRSADELGEQGLDYLGRILSSASRMRSLINDLLNFSRVTTKAQPPEPVNLQKTADEVVSDLEGRLQHCGGRVEVGSLPTIEADPMQIRQLLQNLIGNGLKFQKPDVPPVVRVEAKVTAANGRPPHCVLTVQDNGIGFEEIYLDRIFNVFQRLHGRNEYEGTGMGLAIVRKIVERHGGSITAQSSPGNGARFIVTLPVQQEKKDLDT